MSKKILFLTITILLAPFWALSTQAEEISDEQKQVIDKILELSGAQESALIMGRIITNSMVTVIRKSNPNVKQTTLDILEDEIMATTKEVMFTRGALKEMLYPIYSKHLTLLELKEALNFYQSPIGQKIMKALPQITQESAIAGQKVGATLGPIIAERVKKRLQKEGIKLNNI
ncbi:MAG: DUF2059 domain-containing protein [Sneathiella sp.]